MWYFTINIVAPIVKAWKDMGEAERHAGNLKGVTGNASQGQGQSDKKSTQPLGLPLFISRSFSRT